ncbi:MAG TPA: hypothetical protein VGH83_01985 [Candidatus Acidoferrum sp.]
MGHAKSINKGGDHETHHNQPKKASRNAKPWPVEIGGGAPDGTVPKALGKEKQGNNPQADSRTQKEESPVHKKRPFRYQPQL